LSRSFHTNERGGREQCHRNQHNRDEDATTTAGKCLAEAAVVQETIDAVGETSGTCHGHSYLGCARQRREFKQYLRVGNAACGFNKSSAIAYRFTEVRELAFEPPT
jgi:hypothetical protein